MKFRVNFVMELDLMNVCGVLTGVGNARIREWRNVSIAAERVEVEGACIIIVKKVRV